MRNLAIVLILSLICCVSCKIPRFHYSENDVGGKEIQVESRKQQSYKLPGDIIPMQYTVDIDTYMEDADPYKKFWFHGRVQILVQIKRTTNKIRMHAKNLTILSRFVEDTISGKLIQITKCENSNDDYNFLDIELKEELIMNEYYEIHLWFRGSLDEDGEGFFKRSYTENGEKKWMFATHFEPLGARSAFPCFDEPDMKAVFQIYLATPPNWTALSNMPVKSKTKIENSMFRSGQRSSFDSYFNDWDQVIFYPTEKMSTYSLAFALSQFENITSPTDARFQVWAQPELIKNCEYAASLAPKALKYLENVTGVDYKLPKMDQIAIPRLTASKMESWGLLTYLDDIITYDKKFTTAENFQLTADSIIHLIVHQWFGNLVSPKWWGNLWLNEGFATYLSSYVASHVQPELKSSMDFLINKYYYVLQEDTKPERAPLVDNSVESPSEINSKFDAISFSKGGCIIRMIHNFMGDANFWKGISAYLNEMKNNNADHNDLWRGLSKGVPNGLLPENKEFKDMMNSWALQPGYPVVTVSRDYETNSVSFTQKRFLTASNADLRHEKYYWVPLTMLIQDAPKENANKITWLHNDTRTIKSVPSDKWILVNNEKTGFYCVNYDKKNWKMLFDSINGADLVETLSVNNRVQLLMDALTLAKYKHLDYETALSSTAYLNHEKEYGPWAIVLNEISAIQRKIPANDPAKLLLQKYFLRKMEHLYKHVRGFDLSVESDSLSLRLLRNRTLAWLCSNGHEACNKDGLALFNEWKLNKRELHPELTRLVYAAGIRVGGEEEFKFLFSKYKTETAPHVIEDMLFGLASTKNKSNHLRLLDESTSINSTTFRNEHALQILSAVMSNPDSTETAFHYILKNYFRASRMWGEGGTAFTYVSRLMNTKDQIQKLQSFYDENKLTLTKKELDKLRSSIDYAKTTTTWNDDHMEAITSFLSPKPKPEKNDPSNNSGASSLVSRAVLIIALFLYKLL